MTDKSKNISNLSEIQTGESSAKLAGSCSCESSSDDDKNEKLSNSSWLNLNGPVCTFNAENHFDCDSDRKSRIIWKTICTAGCRYDIIHEVAKNMGLKEVCLDEEWIIHWTDSTVSVDRIFEMKRFQKINHFPGMTEICRKDFLARNMNRMFKVFPIEYSIFPLTWCLPQEYPDLNYYIGTKKRTLICKPESGCQGKGIFLVRTTKDISPTDRQVVQQYITKPFLIDGYKFDFRVYVLITAVEPDFRLYVYKEGLARFATAKYESPSSLNVDNMYMHLTNYAVNRHSCHYIEDDVAGSKRKMTAVTKWWEDHEYNTKEIWERIDDAIIKTFLSAVGSLRHSYRSCFPKHAGVNACFEILGFDILLDQKLNPFILEVNLSPSFHTDTHLDKEVKEGLIQNTLELIDWENCNPKKCREEERKRARNRLFHNVEKGDDGSTTKRKSHQDDIEEIINQREVFELEHKGNFRLIYPFIGSKEKYDKFLPVGLSIHQETIASRAREECANRILREESNKIAKQENRINKEPFNQPILLYTTKSILNPPKPVVTKPKGLSQMLSSSGNVRPSLIQMPRASTPPIVKCRHRPTRIVVKPKVVDMSNPSDVRWPYSDFSQTNLSWMPNLFCYAELNYPRSSTEKNYNTTRQHNNDARKTLSQHKISVNRKKRSPLSSNFIKSTCSALPKINIQLKPDDKHTRQPPANYYWLSSPPSTIRLNKSHIFRSQLNASKLREIEIIDAAFREKTAGI